jgi:phage baseplate assembly protein V
MTNRIVDNLFRLGEVSNINPENYTCRVYFEDQNFTSGELAIMIHGGTRNRDNDMPNIGDQAIVFFFPPLLSDGIVIGFKYNDEDQPVVKNPDIWCKVFPDGSKISYNQKAKQFDIESQGSVNIKASKIYLNGDVIINDKAWLLHQHSAGEYKDGDNKPLSGKSGNGVV